ADMKEASAVRRSPFDRDRNAPLRIERLQPQPGRNLVVIGDRDDGGQTKPALDLQRLRLEDLPSRHWRRPPRAREVDRLAVVGQITLHLALVKPREDGNAGGVMRNESQRLTRMVGVAMQRDGRAKAFWEGERMIAPLVDVQPRQVGYHGVPPFCCRVWFRCEAEDYPNGVTFRSGGK